jgi:hypothetical protein
VDQCELRSLHGKYPGTLGLSKCSCQGIVLHSEFLCQYLAGQSASSTEPSGRTGNPRPARKFIWVNNSPKTMGVGMGYHANSIKVYIFIYLKLSFPLTVQPQETKNPLRVITHHCLELIKFSRFSLRDS